MGELLTVRQVAERLSVHPETVRQWLRAGDLPAVKLGHKRGSAFRVDADELASFVYGAPEGRAGFSPFTAPALPGDGGDPDAA
jgi:excisionase family DNA binding protein